MNKKEMKDEVQFDELAGTYDAELEQLLNPYIRGNDTSKFAEYKIQLLYSVLKGKRVSRILDFGCGVGRSLFYFQKYFGRASVFYGCDVSSESVKMASKAMPEAVLFVNSSIEQFDNFFKEHTKGKRRYDLVFLSCVLHHIEPKDRHRWIKAIMRNLEPGGYIAVFEHNLKNPYTKRIVMDPNNRADNFQFMLTQRELENLLLDSKDVKTIWKGYTLFSLFRPLWIVSAERMLKWCPLGAQHCMIVQKQKV